jgi:uncharacterized protein (DUF1800 family)
MIPGKPEAPRMLCPFACRTALASALRYCIAMTLASTALTAPADARAAVPLARDDIAWLQRASFGLDSASIARYRLLGRMRFLDEQLSGREAPLPAPINTIINSFEVINTPPDQLLAGYRQRKQQFKNAPLGPAKDAAKTTLQQYSRKLSAEDAQVMLLHAIYGSNQLKEQMVWFWLNHFSVYAAKGGVRLVAAHYALDSIRPHALGKFSDLVMATLQSPAMLIYLDNARNMKGKTNENYARELMELHTLGVGSGYTQQDVQQLALILTGAGIVARQQGHTGAAERPGLVRDGAFVFNPQRHDFSDKTLFGQPIKGSGYDEIKQAVQLITRQPACAHFISQQLADYFVADEPPPELVAAMAKTFQRTDGDIAAVLRTLFTSKGLLASRGRKFKDPTLFLVSAMRLANDGQPISNALPLVNWLNQMGEPPFGRITPDGWPLDGASWSGSGQMAKRFEVARQIGSGRNRLFTNDGADDDGRMAVSMSMQHIPGAPKLDGPVFHVTIEPYLSAATRAALAKAASPMEWNTFLLSSPDFNYR